MKSDGGLYVTSILTSRTVKIEIIIFYKLFKKLCDSQSHRLGFAIHPGLSI